MTHFSQAFWSQDYAGGLGVLFGKLQQGVQENNQILTVARLRADAEEVYSQHLGDIRPSTDRILDGFQRDEGASLRRAYEGVRTEMSEAARNHTNIANNIRELVVFPFGKWCEEHATRVQRSQDDLQTRVKAHDRQADSVRKLRSQYFNKCRLLEDLEEENKLAFKEPQSETSSPKPKAPTVRIQEPPDDDGPEPVELGDKLYEPEKVKEIFTKLLVTIKLGETKVPILGTYNNVSTGADIVDYVQNNLGATNVGEAEQIGQDMIAAGFLRLVGNVGNTFANSSKMFYQWRPKVFKITGLPEKRAPVGAALDRSSTTLSLDSIDSPLVGQAAEYLDRWNPYSQHADETPSQRLQRESREADERYKAAVKKLDLLRCTLEEAIIEHLKFMERCELDRLKAMKAVILDFSGAIGNVIPSLQSTVDNMMLFQETAQPIGDLRYLLENYRTGAFIPRVQIYENYYNSVEGQTFGVEVEARAKADRKRVPLIVTTMLTFLDHQYPQLEGDEARRAIWLVEVPLAATHRLRSEINNGMPVPMETLDNYEVPIVAATLKLYLLELPDSLVSSNMYEIIKTIYTNAATADASATETRVQVLVDTLRQLRLNNIACLDAIITHFHRLIDLTSANEKYVMDLTQSLAPCIIRPRTESSLSFEEKYNARLLRDLLEYKDTIFGDLKRTATLNPSRAVSGASVKAMDGRPRAPTDESNRRANVEERNRAIANRSRQASPSSQDRQSMSEQQQMMARHRRDSSRGPSAETRFPVHVVGAASPRLAPNTPKMGATYTPGTRDSLEVPHAEPTAASMPFTIVPSSSEPGPSTNVNGSVHDMVSPTSTATDTTGAPIDAEDRVGRANQRPFRREAIGPRGAAKRDSAGDFAHITTGRSSLEERRGVELVDKPMDD